MAQVVAHPLKISLLATWENIPVEGKAGAGAVFWHFKKNTGNDVYLPSQGRGPSLLSCRG